MVSEMAVAVVEGGGVPLLSVAAEDGGPGLTPAGASPGPSPVARASAPVRGRPVGSLERSKKSAPPAPGAGRPLGRRRSTPANAEASDSLTTYGDEMGKVPLLSAEQEVALARLIERSDRAAKNKFIESNLRFVVAMAQRFSGRGLPLLDLIQEGNIGLMRAVEKFDHRRGCRFTTYADLWVRQSLTRALADQARTVRLPVHKVEAITSWTCERERLRRSLGREPTPEEISARTGIAPEKARALLRADQQPISLDTPAGDDGDAVLADFIEDETAADPVHGVEEEQRRRTLARALEKLPERERRIMQLRHGLADGKLRSFKEIGLELGLSHERIRQLEAKTMVTLAELPELQCLREQVW